MKIGDKVRLLRGTEEGRIVGIRGKIIDVEIEDGFVIPTMLNEVVKIDKNESQTFQKEEVENFKEKAVKNDDFIADGIYLGIESVRESFFEAFIINQTANTILFSISQYDKKIIRGITFGICESYQRLPIGQLTSSIFNDSKRLIVQTLIHEQESRLKKQAIHFELGITQDQLASPVYLATLDKSLHLVNLENTRALHFDPEALREKMLGNSPSPTFKEEIKGQKELTIDLHIDLNATTLKTNEILSHQLTEFENAFDRALVLNVEKLKIIHGQGAGVLRNEIHKRLGSKKEVKYYEDADKERFGFGSTLIYF